MILSHPVLRTNKLSHVRSWLWTIPVAMLTTAVLITAAVVVALFAPGGRRQQWFQHKWGAAVLGIVGARVKVRGAEKVDATANYVIASNHGSLMDICVLFGWLPMPFKFLAKRELLRVPFIGWYLQRDGHLTVDRKSLRSSVESTNECARLIREKRLSVLIFPEGTRSPDGELQRFRDGAAFLAIQSGVPLLPVAIAGAYDVLPTRSSWFMPGEIELRFGDPISVEGLVARDRAALTARLEQAVGDLLAQ